MAETHSQEVHTEQVVLDIGGSIGALILYTDEVLDHAEIELSPKGRTTERFHNQVHQRQFNGRSVFAAVYPHIEAGEYDIWDDSATPVDSATIRGGEVATVDWRGRRVAVTIAAPHRHD
ncbi:MAG: phospholipase [Chloroflexota bacterium]|nr:phospholipase [Chloroflexota bacterium]